MGKFFKLPFIQKKYLFIKDKIKHLHEYADQALVNIKFAYFVLGDG